METIHFAPFRIDVSSGRLLRGGQILELRPKAFDVLRYLAERPGLLVTKEQLLDAVWPEVNVEEAVLKGTVCEIRNALDDSSRQPRFIETAHRKGYRFIGPVEVPALIPAPMVRARRVSPSALLRILESLTLDRVAARGKLRSYFPSKRRVAGAAFRRYA